MGEYKEGMCLQWTDNMGRTSSYGKASCCAMICSRVTLSICKYSNRPLASDLFGG